MLGFDLSAKAPMAPMKVATVSKRENIKHQLSKFNLLVTGNVSRKALAASKKARSG
jgi:hypothetical protein